MEAGGGEPLPHFERGSDEDGDHALQAKGLEVFHVVFVGEAYEGGSECFEVRGDFGAEMGFAPDEGGASEKGEAVTVVVVRVVEARKEVANIAMDGQYYDSCFLRTGEPYTGAIGLLRCTRVGSSSSSSSSSSSKSARSYTGRESSSLVLSSPSSWIEIIFDVVVNGAFDIAPIAFRESLVILLGFEVPTWGTVAFKSCKEPMESKVSVTF